MARREQAKQIVRRRPAQLWRHFVEQFGRQLLQNVDRADAQGARLLSAAVLGHGVLSGISDAI
ncbi:hypothetical protein [Bradyrhizobium septentrionale]|uniref:Transposase n=1 Tax=Bradyrhizobium septentrionale TaxID=1404411 RepID=A0ABZ2NYP1_9BRAD